MKRNIILGLVVCLSGTLAFAETAAEQGLAKLKSNVDNSKANVESYEKNLQIVNGNIAEVSKAKTAVEDQAKELATSVKLNQTALTAADKQEQDLRKQIAQEEKDQLSDEQKIKDLERLMAQTKENQEKRKLNLQDYKTQVAEAAKQKELWKARQDKLNLEQKEMNERLAAVKKSEKEWSNKKRGYEGELSRWKSETEKHNKTLQQYTSLADHKE